MSDTAGDTDAANAAVQNVVAREPHENPVLGSHDGRGTLIAKYRETIDRRAGDGIMVLFNDPVPCEDPAHRAVEMTIEMRAHMQTLLEKWRQNDYDLDFRVGITFGYATLGMVGDDTRSDYTANGTVINLAARLCEDAEANQILVTQRTLSEIEEAFEVESLSVRKFKGITRRRKSSTSNPHRIVQAGPRSGTIT